MDKLAKYLNQIGGTGVVILSLCSGYPHLTGTKSYRRATAMYDPKGDEVPLDEEIKTLAEQVYQDMNLTVDKEMRLKLYTADGKDTLYRGSLQNRWLNAIIGIPGYYSIKKPEEINKRTFGIQVDGTLRPVDWNSEAAGQLLDSMVFSEKAKLFSIAREVSYLDSQECLWDMFLRVGAASGAYAFGTFAYTALNLEQYILGFRLGVFGAIGLVFLGIFVFARDAYHCSLDNKVDRKVAKMRRRYAEGGVEYYTKLLQRNKALREILGYDGRLRFTAYGNEFTPLRTKAVKLSTRLQNVSKRLEAYGDTPDSDDTNINTGSGKGTSKFIEDMNRNRASEVIFFKY